MVCIYTYRCELNETTQLLGACDSSVPAVADAFDKRIRALCEAMEWDYDSGIHKHYLVLGYMERGFKIL